HYVDLYRLYVNKGSGNLRPMGSFLRLSMLPCPATGRTMALFFTFFGCLMRPQTVQFASSLARKKSFEVGHLMGLFLHFRDARDHQPP
ncbi:MAG TPA: hypothetical protein VKV03_00085, partial [Candidatus Binataceae bacterium]|nr:hypothetical protein [Candidatus Binataceae bacterium]